MQRNSNDSSDFQCPICKDLFEDPYFVCPNHHSLCRRCHSSLINTGTLTCPICRALMTTPVENSLMRSAVQQIRIQKSLCQECNQSNKKAFSLCYHCDKNLCQLHLSHHRIDFEKECQQRLMEAENKIEVAEKEDTALQQEFSKIIDHCILELQKIRSQVQATLKNSSQSTPELKAAVARLREGVKRDDMQEMKEAFDRMRAVPVSDAAYVIGGSSGLRLTGIQAFLHKTRLFDEKIALMNKPDCEKQALKEIFKVLVSQSTQSTDKMTRAAEILAKLDPGTLRLCLGLMALK